MALRQPLDDKVRDALSRPMTVVDISTTGRKSGQERRIEIVMHNIDGRLYISGQPSRRRRSWLANLDANPKFTLHVKRGARADLPATAREITDPVERRQVLQQVARHWRRDDVDTMVQYSPLIEVTL
jgi:deazaflavin-dependent oxidoreductase (nitroreductase family)